MALWQTAGRKLQVMIQIVATWHGALGNIFVLAGWLVHCINLTGEHNHGAQVQTRVHRAAVCYFYCMPD
jgi:hypothetical protein